GDRLILHVGGINAFRAAGLPEIVVGVVGDGAELELLPFGWPRGELDQAGLGLRTGIGNDPTVPLHVIQAVAIDAAGEHVAARTTGRARQAFGLLWVATFRWFGRAAISPGRMMLEGSLVRNEATPPIAPEP